MKLRTNLKPAPCVSSCLTQETPPRAQGYAESAHTCLICVYLYKGSVWEPASLRLASPLSVPELVVFFALRLDPSGTTSMSLGRRIFMSSAQRDEVSPVCSGTRNLSLHQMCCKPQESQPPPCAEGTHPGMRICCDMIDERRDCFHATFAEPSSASRLACSST